MSILRFFLSLSHSPCSFPHSAQNVNPARFSTLYLCSHNHHDYFMFYNIHFTNCNCSIKSPVEGCYKNDLLTLQNFFSSEERAHRAIHLRKTHARISRNLLAFLWICSWLTQPALLQIPTLKFSGECRNELEENEKAAKRDEKSNFHPHISPHYQSNKGRPFSLCCCSNIYCAIQSL